VSDSLVISCEHASNRVPAAYRALFRDDPALLQTHAGWDIGAANLARTLGRDLGAPVFLATWTRLLIDANRSLRHGAVFSRWTRALPAEQRAALVSTLYLPYRSAVKAAIAERLRGDGRVLHVAVHSFTPRLRGVSRNADIGLLYDPRRRRERDFCLAWQAALTAAAPRLRVRRNYPYRGTSDGFSVALRRALPASRYACIELEVNQGSIGRRELRAAVAATLRQLRI
jgi:predicted N-formylglutamate amidohydrolase